MITASVQTKALDLASTASGLPAYIYDLDGLREHASGIRNALSGSGVELMYAAKANPDPVLLRVLEPYVAGFEVASGGEFAHVRTALPHTRIAFGGPGKTDEELALALELGVDRLHVESAHELARLARISSGAPVDILLRANLSLEVAGAALTMSGPFGMDEAGLAACVEILREAPSIRVRGIHTHLASGLHAEAMLQLGHQILSWGLPWLEKNVPQVGRPEIVLGGGMAVDYSSPDSSFDWTAYGKGLPALANPAQTQLRIEPGRAVTVYDGYYVTDVLDVKWNHGQAYAILRGGTHHLRTPATKGHSQPFGVLHRGGDGPSLTSTSATLVGQLCTPKDVLAREVPVVDLQVGDLVVFEMTGAYAWNISHHDFLMHPKPGFHYVGDLPVS